ncbi:MAG: hypothetical protein M2R45_05145 [Verrucomicrobia subdivision 3 bacterium]|nr:hypothetical protein [Limisphaerales bacterium]MCS1413787.1 hypothetical protein [Limisphaerales bacterium]
MDFQLVEQFRNLLEKTGLSPKSIHLLMSDRLKYPR